MMREIDSIHCADIFQSIYFIKELGLLLRLHVDDMVLSDPENQLQNFWEKVQKNILKSRSQLQWIVSWGDTTKSPGMNMEPLCNMT